MTVEDRNQALRDVLAKSAWAGLPWEEDEWNKVDGGLILLLSGNFLKAQIMDGCLVVSITDNGKIQKLESPADALHTIERMAHWQAHQTRQTAKAAVELRVMIEGGA